MTWVLLLLLALPAAADTITLEQYVHSLERIRGLLASNQLPLAREEAGRLAAHDVSSPQGTFHADASLLGAIGNAQRPDLRLQTRLAVTIAEIRTAANMGGAEADPKLLERVTAEQKLAELPRGGELKLPAARLSFLERFMQTVENIVEWIADKIGDFIEWLIDLLPIGRGGMPAATGGMRWIVTALVVLIVLLIVLLAFQVARRSRRKESKAKVESIPPIGSRADEDPLSRGANEWERYAAQLAAAGRYREAIRAWYHAVLVTCYSAGILHYRKSRTNWEYIAALSPTLTWRPEFIQLTRRFEQEWYGADQSTEEALEQCSGRARAIIGSVRDAARGAA